MKLYEKYIAKTLIKTVLLAMIVLLGVDLFFYAVNEFRYLGKGNYTLSILFLFLFLKIPTKLYIMFPWSVILGTLLGLGSLAKNSELVAMQASAISVKNISIATLKGALVLTVIMFFFGEYVSPKTEILAQNKKTQSMSVGQAIKTEYGLWVRNKNEFIHIKTILSNKELNDVTRYEFDDDLRLQEISIAKKAKFINGVWVLYDLKGTKITPENTFTFNKNVEKINKLLDLEILKAAGVKHLERLSIRSLFKVMRMRQKNELNAVDYELAFWRKIVQPLVILVMVFVVVPFIFGPLRSSSVGLKILMGIFVGFTLHTLNTIFAPLTIVINMPPIIAVILPVILFFVFGCFYMNKVRN